MNLANPFLPPDMLTLLRMGDATLSQVRDVLAEPQNHMSIPLSEVRLGPPISNPSKIICLGLNYQDHSPKSDPSTPVFPTIFAKYANCIVGPGDPIIIPSVSDQVDYEAELAVVIGKRGKDIPLDQAIHHIAGYTCFNDVSARDYQSRTSQWLQGKTFDTFGPMGPALVTSDEISDPGTLEISLALNGQTMQHSNTSHLIFSIPQIIVYLSQIMTLEVGDVLSTGTPGGVGALRNPPVFLKAGDQVEVRIEGVGILYNPVSVESLQKNR
ncbi:fumarylacetoacetate hydrolase family protein [Longilinea arvoryzae]|uniref:fumarylacetoacetate hydrolase family protein n=1 Tax=Longilinea arvoryzae TaxID=360412 RepID=UPI00191C189D|nr:fumarylacetoacetate hydrolase family protein [Longilinea arvoryzae]